MTLERFRKMKKTHAALCLTVLSTMILTLASCFGDVENEYRITVPTFATVTYDEGGNVRLYLDEKRGIIDPSPESANIKWGNATRALIKYDLPIITGENIAMENLRFEGIVRSAVKIDTVAMVDVTGLDKYPDTLGNDTLLGFNFHAYWGYITMQVWMANNFNFDMTCSFDREKFDGENLYLNLHYAEKPGTWNNEFLQTVSATLPEFVREKGAVTSDSLNIIMSAPVWCTADKDSAYVDTVKFKISRGRLNPPTFGYITGGK